MALFILSIVLAGATIVVLTSASIWMQRRHIKNINEEDYRRRQAYRKRYPNTRQRYGVVISTCIDTIYNQLRTQAYQQDRQDRERSFREKITVGALIAAGIGAILSAGLLWQQLVDSKKIAAEDQRPWVGMSAIEGVKIPTVGTNYFIRVNFTNGGKTPAVRIKATFAAQMRRMTDPPKFPPDACSDCGDGELALPNIPIGKTPHVDGREIREFDIFAMTLKFKAIWLTGRIDYYDVTGSPHKTFICYLFMTDSSFRSCDIPNSNYAD